MDYSPPGSSVHGILQQEYWSGLPFTSPGDLPDPGIEPGSPTLQEDSLLAEPPGKPSIAFEEGPEVLDFVYGLNYYHFVLLDCLSFLLQLLTF